MKILQTKQPLLIQVDEFNKPVGLIEKKEAHVKGILHRAFSVFIFRKGNLCFELLLQKRADSKYHSGGLWTNTCCSHAEPNTPIAATARMRLFDEMGFSCPLTFIDSFNYRAVLDNGMIENEIDCVFAGMHDPGQISLNPEEASAYRWASLQEITQSLKKNPQEFTVWFPQAFQISTRFLSENPPGDKTL